MMKGLCLEAKDVVDYIQEEALDCCTRDNTKVYEWQRLEEIER